MPQNITQTIQNLHICMGHIHTRMEDTTVSGMCVEIIVWALQYMKENPEADIIDAFEAGCNEWDV